MTETTQQNAIYVGGPNDGSRFSAGTEAVVEVEIDGLVHRYIHTTAHRDIDGQSLVVFNYDGVIDPDGALPGVETR